MSAMTEVMAILTTKPMTTREIAAAVDIANGHASAVLHDLVRRGGVTETVAEGMQKGRLVAAYMLAKPREDKPVRERGEYKGERLPLRYRQRDEAGITLG